MKGIEPIMDEIRYYLRSEIEAKIDELIAEYDDDVELPDIPSDAVHLETPEGQEFRYPCFVISERSFSEAGASPELMEVTYRIGVEVWDTSNVDGFENLHRRLWRYCRAIIEILRGHATDATNWVDIDLSDRRPGPIMTKDEREYFRAKSVIVSVICGEDYD